MVTKTAVIGIDLGTSDSYVAYVGKGIVDIVQNEVSKRNTSTLVGFTDRERLLGDAALAQIKSNAKNTCRNFKHLLGRKVDSPDLSKESFWSTCKLTTADDGFAGYDITYKGESRCFSATQITAMYITKLKEITEQWCQAKVADVVIAVPSYFCDVQRQAVLDAAKIAGLSVLRLMNEHTATALSYGIYRSNDFDPEKPCTVAFCSMGHALFTVSIVQFVRGKLNVLLEKSELVGGRDMDECLMREFAAQFQKKFGCDPLSNKKAAFKLEDAVTKTKKILSANSESPISVECLMEDEDFASQITRADFEKMCEPAMMKAKAVLDAVVAESPVPIAEIDFVEVVGGASRVPWVKKICSDAFGGKELSTTMNQEESVSRGCALQAAILSPLYKVRDFKVEENSPFGISIGWMGSATDSDAPKAEEDETPMIGGEGEYKSAAVFPANSPMNLLKMLSFYRAGSFDLKAEYIDEKLLLPGTPKELGTFRIEVPSQPEPKKIKVKAKLTLHGTFSLEGAQMVEEEEYEEKVKEKREIVEEKPEEPAKPAEEEPKKEEGDAQAAADKEGAENKQEEKAAEKKYEWIDVTKKKKRTKRTDLKVTATGVPGLSNSVLEKRSDEEFAMQAEMREIIDTDAKRNDLEGYIFNMRDRICEGNEYGTFISSADRDSFNSALTAMEDWLYDTFDATKTQYIEKLEELKATGDPVAWRAKESGMRAEWITAVTGTVKNYKSAAENPGEKYSHISPDKLSKILTACNELESWLSDLQAKQEKVPPHEKPVLTCADMEKKNKELAETADEILKEPKPAPPKEEKPAEPPKEEAKAEDAPKEEAPPSGPENIDVD